MYRDALREPRGESGGIGTRSPELLRVAIASEICNRRVILSRSSAPNRGAWNVLWSPLLEEELAGEMMVQVFEKDRERLPSGALFLLKPCVRLVKRDSNSAYSRDLCKAVDAKLEASRESHRRIGFRTEVQNKMRAQLTIDLIAEPFKDREDSVSEGGVDSNERSCSKSGTKVSELLPFS